jgi:hypothetical protein
VLVFVTLIAGCNTGPVVPSVQCPTSFYSTVSKSGFDLPATAIGPFPGTNNGISGTVVLGWNLPVGSIGQVISFESSPTNLTLQQLATAVAQGEVFPLTHNEPTTIASGQNGWLVASITSFGGFSQRFLTPISVVNGRFHLVKISGSDVDNPNGADFGPLLAIARSLCIEQ